MTSSTEVPYRLPVAIDGHAYRIDVEKYRRSTLPMVRDAQDGSDEPGEQTLTSEGVWRRSQESWYLGVGQQFFDRIPHTLVERVGRTRAYTSRGFDMFASDGRLSLLHETARILSSSSVTQVLMANGTLYYTDGTDVKYSTNFSGAPGSVTWTAVNLGGAVPVWLTTDGVKVFIACTASVRTSTIGTAVSANLVATAAVPQKIAYCNGRLVIAIANELKEVTYGGALTAIGSHANTSFRYTSITAAPNAIYAAGAANNVGEVYSMTIDAGTGAISAPVHATSLPTNETANEIRAYGGLMIFATSAGVRVAQISRDDNTLHYGPVIDQYGGAFALETHGRFCTVGVSYITTPVYNDPNNTHDQSSGTIKLDLGNFTEDLVPAYAPDVAAPLAGVTLGLVSSICSHNGYRYFSFNNALGGGGALGIFAEQTTYVPNAVALSGLIRHGTIEQKVLVGADWRHESLPAGATVGLNVVDESGSYLAFSATTTTSSLGSGLLPFPFLGTLGEEYRVFIYATRPTDTTTTPKIKRWTVRTLIAPQRIDEIIVPIVCKSSVDTFNDSAEKYDTAAEFDFLKSLEASGAVVTYQEGSRTISCKVDRVELQPEKWTDLIDGTMSFEGLMMVRLLTIPV